MNAIVTIPHIHVISKQNVMTKLVILHVNVMMDIGAMVLVTVAVLMLTNVQLVLIIVNNQRLASTISAVFHACASTAGSVLVMSASIDLNVIQVHMTAMKLNFVMRPLVAFDVLVRNQSLIRLVILENTI